MKGSSALLLNTLWACAVALLAVLAVTGCEPARRWVLDSPSFFPTALDFWAEERAFLVGSYHDGSIRRIALDGRSPLVSLQETRAKSRQRALRLRIDGERGRLWVLDVDAVYVYSLPEYRLLRWIAMPKAVPSKRDCLPDLALDPSTGVAYVSDGRAPTIYVIRESAEKDTLERIDLPVRFERGKGHGGGFSALLVNDHPRALIAGSASAGRMWRIDPATGEAGEILVPHLEGICGISTIAPGEIHYLYHPRHRPLVYVSRGFAGGVMRIVLSPDLRGGTVVYVAPNVKLDTPTSLVAFRSLVVVAHSQLSRHEDFGGVHDPVLPFRLAIVPSGPNSLLIVDR